jgi:hypothetical protein
MTGWGVRNNGVRLRINEVGLRINGVGAGKKANRRDDTYPRHCEARSDVAIHLAGPKATDAEVMDCHASLSMNIWFYIQLS